MGGGGGVIGGALGGRGRGSNRVGQGGGGTWIETVAGY